MTAIRVSLVDNYSDKDYVEVDQWEGNVHLDTKIDGTRDQPSLSPAAARALAAVILHQADEVDR